MTKNRSSAAGQNGARAVSGIRTLSTETPLSPLAWDARPSHLETLTDRRVSAARQGRPLTVRRYDDATHFDRYLAAGAITPRQHDACRILYGWAVRAGHLTGVVASMSAVGDEAETEFDPPPEPSWRDPEAPGPSDRLRRVLRDLGQTHAGLVTGLIFGPPPAGGWVAQLGVALDRAADMLGLG